VNFDENASDETLAQLAKSGERGAFDVLVIRHKAGLYRFIRRYVGPGDDAYDILQDCFVSAWLGLARYDSERAFPPWLRTIALNKCRDFARRQKVRRLILSAFAAETDNAQLTEPESSVDDSAAVRLDRLDQVISRLPAFYKEPLLLTTVAGLSHIEAANELNTTPKAIEMRLYRARRKILHEMGENTLNDAEG
jgi:RNA polymerase sigma-70 factor (ECF subfamily)